MGGYGNTREHNISSCHDRALVLSVWDPSTLSAAGPNQNTSRIQILKQRSLSHIWIMIGFPQAWGSPPIHTRTAWASTSSTCHSWHRGDRTTTRQGGLPPACTLPLVACPHCLRNSQRHAVCMELGCVGLIPSVRLIVQVSVFSSICFSCWVRYVDSIRHLNPSDLRPCHPALDS